MLSKHRSQDVIGLHFYFATKLFTIPFVIPIAPQKRTCEPTELRLPPAAERGRPSHPSGRKPVCRGLSRSGGRSGKPRVLCPPAVPRNASLASLCCRSKSDSSHHFNFLSNLMMIKGPGFTALRSFSVIYLCSRCWGSWKLDIPLLQAFRAKKKKKNLSSTETPAAGLGTAAGGAVTARDRASRTVGPRDPLLY